MSKILGKRQLVLATLVLALGAAVFVNWYYTKPENAEGVFGGEETSVQTDKNLGDAEYVSSSKALQEYFANAKLNRDAVHDQAMATLQQMVSSINSEDGVAAANLSLEQFSQVIKQETNIETLVTAKTGSESVAIINGDKIEVIVDNKVLDDNVVMQIKDIVLKNTSISSDNITIIGAK
ncbi:MAG: SpoIIIAH-like family protein [Oscillospiraceae bacterium]|jgi:stage III sporulation protein AH|nr:SpoIIIAH-like family protein [Oscillospiraceae bacterium]